MLMWNAVNSDLFSPRLHKPNGNNPSYTVFSFYSQPHPPDLHHVVTSRDFLIISTPGMDATILAVFHVVTSSLL